MPFSCSSRAAGVALARLRRWGVRTTVADEVVVARDDSSGELPIPKVAFSAGMSSGILRCMSPPCPVVAAIGCDCRPGFDTMSDGKRRKGNGKDSLEAVDMLLCD